MESRIEEILQIFEWKKLMLKIEYINNILERFFIILEAMYVTLLLKCKT